MNLTKRVVLLLAVVVILALVSGCVGFSPPDRKATGFLKVQAASETCGVWLYDTEVYASGYWTGGVAGSKASGEGTLVLYNKEKQKLLEYRGGMVEGYASGTGQVIAGEFDVYGDLTKYFFVYQGEWSGGLPNGEGIVWSYQANDKLEYIVEGTFKDFAVTGKYFYTKDGKREVREVK